MGGHKPLTPRDVDQILSGRAPVGGDRVDDALAAFARDTQRAFARPVPTAVEERHLAGVVAIAQASSAARSVVPSHRRLRPRVSLAALVTRLALAAMAIVAAGGGLAAAQVLPGPAQDLISNVAHSVGISIPRATHAPDPEHGGGSPTSTVHSEAAGRAGQPTSTVTPTATPAPNHGACVSYAAELAVSLNLSDNQIGAFVSDVAQDTSAITAQVPDGGHPDAPCQAAITAAQTAATSAAPAGPSSGGGSSSGGGNGGGNGNTPGPSVTSTSKGQGTPTPSTSKGGSNPHGNTSVGSNGAGGGGSGGPATPSVPKAGKP